MQTILHSVTLRVTVTGSQTVVVQGTWRQTVSQTFLTHWIVCISQRVSGTQRVLVSVTISQIVSQTFLTQGS